MGIIRRVAVALIGVAALAGCTSRTAGESTPLGSGGSNRPAMLEFRKVAQTEAANTPSTSVPPAPSTVDQAEVDKAKAARQKLIMTDHDAVRAAFDVLDCTAPDPLHGKDDPALPLITCDPVLPAKYALEPAFLTGADVERAQARLDQNTGNWVVDVSFRSEGTRAWADFTTKNVGEKVAVVVDARVVSAPEIREAIVGGATVISGPVGGFSKQEAEDLARNLGSR